jgi:hypothetical protein
MTLRLQPDTKLAKLFSSFFTNCSLKCALHYQFIYQRENMNDWRDRRSWEGLRPGEDLAPEEILPMSSKCIAWVL